MGRNAVAGAQVTADNSETKPAETWGELGPAMRELNERQRLFVRHLLLEKPGMGAPVRAARAAGYNGKWIRNVAHDLTRNLKVLAALSEEARKIIRGPGYAEAVGALMRLVRDPKHRDHARGIGMVLDRADPLISKHEAIVTHRHENPDQAALEELKALRKLGTTRDKLLELYGPNGLDRLEMLEAAEIAQRAAAAKVVNGKLIEVDNG
jgi:hypothetical protein